MIPLKQLEKAILKNMYYGSLFVLNFDFSNIKPSEIKGPGVDHDLKKRWYYSANHYKVTSVTGTIFWYKNFELHRDDGPAVEHSNGDEKWFLNGNRYSEEEFDRLKC